MAEVRAVSAASDDDLTDEVLLERYTSRREDAAFAALVRRYGPLVLGVCRRVLHHEQDAEDAFQAVFCVLARRAGSIRHRATVGAWLHAVAYRIAWKARKAKGRQPMSATNLPDIPAAEDTPEWVWHELRAILDQEVSRLPEKYRQAFILCYLQGRTNEQAAALLGCPLGTLLSRLARARERLRGRLTRRGLALSAGTLAAVLGGQATAAVVPTVLTHATVAATAAFMGGGTTAGTLSTTVSAAAEECLRSWARARLIRTTVATLTALVAVALVLLFLHRPGAERAVALRTDQERLQGTWGLSAMEAGGNAGPVQGFRIRFAGDVCTMTSAIAAAISARYQLDPSRTPKEITLTPAPGVTWPGIYELEGDSLRMCVNHGGSERPAAFSTRAKPTFFLYLLKREAAASTAAGAQPGGAP